MATTPASAAALAPSVTSTQRPRDVIVAGTAPWAYTLTDALRDAGLSVGSWMLPVCSAPDRTTQALAHLAANPPAEWATATTLISLWESAALASVSDPVIRTAAPHHTAWLDLSPHSPHRHTATLRAPLIVNRAGHLWVPPSTRHALLYSALTTPHHRALAALASLPLAHPLNYRGVLPS